MRTLLTFVLTIAGTSFTARAQAQAVTYAKSSGVRVYEDQNVCQSDGGQFSKADGSCYLIDPEGNTITITRTEFSGHMVNTVDVETIYGAVNQRSFFGKVISLTPLEAKAEEIDRDTGKRIDRACVLTIRFSGDSLASAIPNGEFCDSGLTIIDAKKEQ